MRASKSIRKRRRKKDDLFQRKKITPPKKSKSIALEFGVGGGKKTVIFKPFLSQFMEIINTVNGWFTIMLAIFVKMYSWLYSCVYCKVYCIVHHNVLYS